ncbi:MAG: hypothetical protein H6553_10560 [Chitinophagales bacterium]|nr:hypothetical protein [Chitinophagales bacterium]
MDSTTIDIAYNEQEWEAVLDQLENRFQKRPDVTSIIFLIGHRTLGQFETKIKKEVKQDFMHIGVCTLLSEANYYKFVGKDEDGWPHYEYNNNLPKLNHKEQEQLLKKMIIEYFKNL